MFSARNCIASRPRHCEEPFATKQSIPPFTRLGGLLRCARNDDIPVVPARRSKSSLGRDDDFLLGSLTDPSPAALKTQPRERSRLRRARGQMAAPEAPILTLAPI